MGLKIAELASRSNKIFLFRKVAVALCIPHSANRSEFRLLKSLETTIDQLNAENQMQIRRTPPKSR
jgi:hypothetical protein